MRSGTMTFGTGTLVLLSMALAGIVLGSPVANMAEDSDDLSPSSSSSIRSSLFHRSLRGFRLGAGDRFSHGFGKRLDAAAGWDASAARPQQHLDLVLNSDAAIDSDGRRRLDDSPPHHPSPSQVLALVEKYLSRNAAANGDDVYSAAASSGRRSMKRRN